MNSYLNLVGGIYTVLKTKVPITVEEYGNRYCLIGPLSKKNSSLEVEICEPEDSLIQECLNEMRCNGVKVLFGKWLVDGSPSVILFDLEAVIHRLNEWKSDLWNFAGIPSPSNDQEMNDAIIFGYLNAWFLGLVLVASTEFDPNVFSML
jgi:glycogen(starch) synthase